MEDLVRLAQLIKTQNTVTQEVSALIGRLALFDYVGEYIAARIFGISLETPAGRKSVDGFFAGGPLAGRPVNVKWYGRQEGLLDVPSNTLPDFYLALT
ncbi:MAG: hypothetical protein L0322_07475, partial [Chloroflexi bacterium]|nr:hypothetical protein [Chloroflexota bacterium]